MSNSNNNLELQKQQMIADILIVTVTKIETKAVLESVDNYSCIPIDNKTYYDLGFVGGAKTLMVRSEMGSGGPSGSTITILEAINTVHPSHIIMIGIAFGINPDKQRIGNILVSQQILEYELQRVGTGKENERTITFRGDRISASPKLLDRFNNGDIHWTGPHVEFGLILSGQKLLDNLNFRNQLRKMEPEAIGGEMEGAGLYSAASSKKVDWILIKAICDWADGKKHEEKSQRQQQAAENAAHFAFHVIKQGGFSKDEQFVVENREYFAELSAEVREVVLHLESLVDRKLVTWDMMREAYNDSIPKRHDSPTFSQDEEQNCLKAIYSIAILPQDKENPPLVQFSCDIADQLSGSEQKSLNQLILKYFNLSCSPKDSEPEKASSCDLWVVVSTDTFNANCYSVTIYLNKIMLLETESIEAKAFRTILENTLQEAYSELMSHLSVEGLCEEHVWIRFFLPRILLSEAVDQYELDEETWGTLGTEFKITVSSWERAKYPKYSVSVRKCWMKYKEKMVNDVRCSDDINSLKDSETYIPAFIVNHSDSPKQVFVKTKGSKVVVAMLPFPPKTISLNDKTDYLNALIQAGVPVILWTRNAESNFIPTDNVLENCMFCKQKLTELPDRVYEERNAAYGADESSHIGNHLTLLWDDPELCLDEQFPLKGAE